jgi:hypothetical protein
MFFLRKKDNSLFFSSSVIIKIEGVNKKLSNYHGMLHNFFQRNF